MSGEIQSIRTALADRPHVAVIIPNRNEERIIETTVAEVLSTLLPLDIRPSIVCVDDGSTDNTWTVLKTLAAKFEEVVVVRLSRNFGHDPALFAGMKVINADAVITMDADGQHPCSAMLEMIHLWRTTGCNIVHGVKRDRGEEGKRYSVAVGAFSKVLSQTLQQDLSNATEFKLLDRTAVDVLLACGDQNVFYRALAAWIGFEQRSVPFDVAPSRRGHSTWKIGGLIRFALNGLVTFSDFPIRMLFYLGALSIVGSGLLLLKLAVDLLFVNVQQGYSTLLVLLLLNLGFMMLGLGIIGLYVRTTMLQSLGRPRSIVQEIVGTVPVRKHD